MPGSSNRKKIEDALLAEHKAAAHEALAAGEGEGVPPLLLSGIALKPQPKGAPAESEHEAKEAVGGGFCLEGVEKAEGPEPEKAEGPEAEVSSSSHKPEEPKLPEPDAEQAYRARMRDIDAHVEALLPHMAREDLKAEHREKVLLVEGTGMGVCSRCHWRSGCLSCDAQKAMRYYLKQELTGEERRGRGRPKAKA